MITHFFPEQRQVVVRPTKDKWYPKFYDAWSNMLARCYSENTNRFERYGGRGIRVCERWHTFDLFILDMYKSFVAHAKANNGDTQLDRVDVDGHYFPDNCRWLTRRENNAHRGWDGKGLIAKRVTICFESEEAHDRARAYASRHKTKVSKIVQDHFQHLWELEQMGLAPVGPLDTESNAAVIRELAKR